MSGTSKVEAGAGGLPISQRRWLSPVMRVVNAFPKFILRSPLHGLMSDKLMLLTFTGRASGRSYSLPVSYVKDEGTLLIASDRPWRNNLRTGEQVSVRLKGSERSARVEVFSEEAEVAKHFEIILPKNSTLGRFLGIALDPDGRPNPDDLQRAMRRGIVVILLHLD